MVLLTVQQKQYVPVQVVMSYRSGRRKGWLRATGVFLPCFYILNQGSSDYDPQAKSGPPTACFVWLISKWLGKKKIKRNAVTFENDMKFKCQCPQIKQYWNTAMLICLCAVCGCFHATAATRALQTEALFTLHYKWH